MKFIVFTSLTSFIVLIFLIYILIKNYKKHKKNIEPVCKSIKHATAEFSENIGESCNMFLFEKEQEKYEKMLDNADKWYEVAKGMVDAFTLEDLHRKSINLLKSNYAETHKKLLAAKASATSIGNFDYYNDIDIIDNNIRSLYEGMLSMKNFMHNSVFSEYQKKII